MKREQPSDWIKSWIATLLAPAVFSSLVSLLAWCVLLNCRGRPLILGFAKGDQVGWSEGLHYYLFIQALLVALLRRVHPIVGWLMAFVCYAIPWFLLSAFDFVMPDDKEHGGWFLWSLYPILCFAGVLVFPKLPVRRAIADDP